MAKKRKKSMPSTASRPRARAGRAVNVWITDELGAALDAYLAAARPSPTLTAVVEVALEEFLAQRGHWTLPEGGGS
jgi:hypothetical protein